jgi:uncharacterized protein with von Willebrand factor type A (vWA) domain
MDDKIIEFTHLLRENGLKISSAENMDTFSALGLIGIRDRQLFKDALRATLVKRLVDIPVYDELFDLYFTGLGEIIKAAGAETMAAMEMSEEEFQRFLEQLEETLKNMGSELSELAKALLNNNTGQLEKMLREAAQQANLQNIQRSFQEGQFANALAQMLGFGQLMQELAGLKEALQKAGLSPQQVEQMLAYIDRRLQDLAHMVRSYVRAELEKQDPQVRDQQKMRTLADKSFYYLSEDEIRKMKEAVAKLAQRLKHVIAIRRKRAKRGHFDLQQTLRKNLQYGGVPFKIMLDRRKKEKPQVVILCDVSDSVRNVSRFMLQFVYSIQDLYARVRSFIFVADLGEVTKLFEDNEIHSAIDLALRGNMINLYAHSDFGRAFKMFHRDFLSIINKRTTIIVLGDARNNYNLPHEWVLRDMRQRAKQVIWLNPESKLTWGFGDSEMDRYAPYCDLVEECRNLNQLYRVIDRLVTA